MDKGSEIYMRSMESWLQDNDINFYSTHNEGKSDAAERFIRTLKNKVYKYIISIRKIIRKILNLILVIMLEYWNIRTVFQ